MDLRIDFGPWESVFAGSVYGHEVEIVSNPENFFLTIIYDKRNGSKVGAVIEGYKAFSAKGVMESFIQTIPKPSFGVTKTLGEKTSKVFFLSFDPFYVDFKSEDFTRKIDLAVRRTEENASTITDLARASSLDLKELSMAPKSEYGSILGDPFAIRMLVSGSEAPALTKLNIGQRPTGEEVASLVQLGLGKTREIIKEPIENLKRTSIVGFGSALDYSMYIMIENFLLENVPVIVFDSKDYFDGLNIASNERTALRDELVDYEPMGFPVKTFIAKENIKVSLRDADLFLVLDLLGLRDAEFQKNLSLFCFTSMTNTPQELIVKILESRETSEYEKLRAERMLSIIDKSFSLMFGKEIPGPELTKPIPGKLGRAIIIDTKTLAENEKTIFIHTLLRQITKSFSQENGAQCVVAIPDAENLFAENAEKASTAITRLENRGAGVLLGTQKELPGDLAATMTAKVSLVAEKDVAVSIKGKRNYRVILRPSLSGNQKVN